jgi:hypothetical protein
VHAVEPDGGRQARHPQQCLGPRHVIPGLVRGGGAGVGDLQPGAHQDGGVVLAAAGGARGGRPERRRGQAQGPGGLQQVPFHAGRPGRRHLLAQQHVGLLLAQEAGQRLPAVPAPAGVDPAVQHVDARDPEYPGPGHVRLRS